MKLPALKAATVALYLLPPLFIFALKIASDYGTDEFILFGLFILFVIIYFAVVNAVAMALGQKANYYIFACIIVPVAGVIYMLVRLTFGVYKKIQTEKAVLK